MKAFVSNILKNLAHPATLVGIIVALAIPFFVYWAPNHGKKDLIQLLENQLPLPLFIVQFIAIIVFAVLLRKDFRDWFKSILPERKITILMVVFTAAISLFALTQIEARHRVQSDESVFMSVAQNMYHNQQGSTCNQGYYQDNKLQCIATSHSFKTKGLSFLYTMGIPLLGKDLHWIFTLEFMLLPLAVLLMFLAVVAWTRQPLLAFFASLLTALQPTVLFQFRSMSVEPLYILLSALSLLIFHWAHVKNTWRHWVLFALVLAFFGQTRQETVFCFAPFILFALPRLLDSRNIKAPLFFTVLSLFSVPVLLMISAYQGFGFQGGEFDAHGHFLEDLQKNWEVMTTPLNNDGELVNPFLTYFNWLFAAGAVYLVIRAIADPFCCNKEKRFFHLKLLVFILLYHVQSYVILENVSGDFNIQINQRYSLVMIPTMAFLAALPVAHLTELLIRTFCKEKISALATATLALLIATGFTGWTFHYKDCFNKNIMYRNNHLTVEEYEIMNWLAEQPGKDRLFIYGRPWHFIGYGISSIHYNSASRMSDSELGKLLDRYQGEVYYIRGLDCWDSKTYHAKAVEHRIPTTCDVFERDMEMEGVKNILITNNYWVQIAKFHGRKNYNNKNVLEVQHPEIVETAADSLSLGYKLGESGNATQSWKIRITMNGVELHEAPYVRGEYRRLISIPSLLPGFNRFQFSVVDVEKDKAIANHALSYFYAGEGAIPLADMNYESHFQGWGSLKKNKSIEGNALTIDGKNYDSGLGTHSPSETVYNIEGKYSSLKAVVGLDDESLCSEGVIVEVDGDGVNLFKSPVFTNGKANLLDIPIAGVHKLTLKSSPAEGNMDCTHVDFADIALIP